jgi:hypothetical protein
MATRFLWTCPRCERSFANRNQSHACGRYGLGRHFEGVDDEVGRIFEAFRAMLEGFGPVTMVPEKTRIAFQVRMSFAQLTLRQHWALGHFVLARAADSALFTKVESLSPRNHVHHFRLDRMADVARLRDFAREAYAVGRQEHLQRNALG